MHPRNNNEAKNIPLDMMLKLYKQSQTIPIPKTSSICSTILAQFTWKFNKTLIFRHPLVSKVILRSSQFSDSGTTQWALQNGTNIAQI